MFLPLLSFHSFSGHKRELKVNFDIKTLLKSIVNNHNNKDMVTLQYISFILISCNIFTTYACYSIIQPPLCIFYQHDTLFIQSSARKQGKMDIRQEGYNVINRSLVCRVLLLTSVFKIITTSVQCHCHSKFFQYLRVHQFTIALVIMHDCEKVYKEYDQEMSTRQMRKRKLSLFLLTQFRKRKA